MAETTALRPDFFPNFKKCCEDSFGKRVRNMCLKHHQNRYATPKTENILLFFSDEVCTYRSFGNTYQHKKHILIDLPLKIDRFPTHFLAGAV